MRMPNWIRQHLAAVRALLVLTVVTGIVYPLAVWAVAFLPGLHDRAQGSMVKTAGGVPAGSRMIGQAFTDSAGDPLKQYLQSRPSAAGEGYDPTSTSAGNLGPESIVDTLPDPAIIKAGKEDENAKRSLLTQVCSRSVAVGRLEGVDGSRPFCTKDGVGAVLAVLGPRGADGHVSTPTKVVSLDQQAPAVPFITTYRGVRVESATFGQDYSAGEVVPIRGDAPATPKVPADAVTASGSGLDPDISPAYARLQAARVAKARGITVAQVLTAINDNQEARAFGFIGEPRVNVLLANLELDKQYPVRG